MRERERRCACGWPGGCRGSGTGAGRCAEAERRGLRGWVRNEADGSVAAVLVGQEAAVGAMVEAMWRGPPDARVAGVSVEPAEDRGFAGFEVRR